MHERKTGFRNCLKLIVSEISLSTSIHVFISQSKECSEMITKEFAQRQQC